MINRKKIKIVFSHRNRIAQSDSLKKNLINTPFREVSFTFDESSSLFVVTIAPLTPLDDDSSGLSFEIVSLSDKPTLSQFSIREV